MTSVDSMVSLKWKLFYRKLALKKRWEVSFPGSSDGKASAYNAGDPGSIPDQEDPLEKGMATHSSILAWNIPCTEVGYIHGDAEPDMTEQLTLSQGK